MNAGPEDRSREIALPKVKEQLKALAALQPPDALRDKLLAAVPDIETGKTAVASLPRWSQTAGYIGIAAVFILVASVLLRLVTPIGLHPRPVADINDRSTSAALTDQNSLRPHDINVCDSNASP
jgi:hypothetical protein